jgi:hypothetical protein
LVPGNGSQMDRLRLKTASSFFVVFLEHARVFIHEHHRVSPQEDDVTTVQYFSLNLLVIYEGAAGRTEIGDHIHVVLERDLGVFARDGGVVDDAVVLCMSANRGLLSRQWENAAVDDQKATGDIV